MKGLYLLTTTLLDIMKVIKFGMSMRIEFRWIDYLSVFADSKYKYYYEFSDEYTKNDILEIENEIIQLHQDKRSKYFQTEYFDCDDTEKFHNDIIELLNKKGIKYKDHSNHNFKREYYDNKPESLENKVSSNNKYKPYTQQEIIINKAYEHLQENNKGLLVLMCGVGKTLISLWISLKLNTSTILVGVPNKLLLKQWSKEIKKVFPNINYFLVKGGTTLEEIDEFITMNKKFIMITTYSSCHKVLTVTKKNKFKFDMKINDECHHLTSSNIKLNQTKNYIEMLNINSNKQLSLTATIKNLDSDQENIISNDNINYFGKIIDKKCLLWAIQNNIVCDYVIQTIIIDDKNLETIFNDFNITEDTDKRLFLTAYSSLKSICDNHSHHLLVYANNMDNSVKLIQYIELLLKHKYFHINNMYYSSYNSMMKSKDQSEILGKFEKAKYGIITCVYCLGEGYDLPLLDGVVFSETMTSNIRIVQSALRASRKNNEKEPDKITKIILPILNKDDWLQNSDNSDFKKVNEVIYQMGLEDETISQKIKVYKILITKQEDDKEQKSKDNTINEFGYYNDELTQQLRLKTVKRHMLNTSYGKAKKIIADKNIKSKQSYYELCEKDNRLTSEPEILYNGQFTNWIDYLGIERLYYDLETCKNKITEYLLLYPEIKTHYLDLSIINEELCKLDALFPPNGLWIEYYNVKNLQDIITINRKKTSTLL